MIRSMTGYGAASAPVDGDTVTVEIRSVNQRGLKVTVRGPVGSEAWEARLRELVAQRITRGRIDIHVRVEEGEAAGGHWEIDRERIEDVLNGLEQLRSDFGVTGTIDFDVVLRTGEVFRRRTADPDPDPLLAAVSAATAEALEALIGMRDAEGERLEADLRGRVEALETGLETAEARAPARLERERERLRAAVAELAEERLDEDRLLREIALIADRWNVSEELVRARAHLAAFVEYLDRSHDEAVGKRLGFLVQELQREINTLGAKANDIEISRTVVEMKNEIEKLREQVENVE